jgi:hypothetical protein
MFWPLGRVQRVAGHGVPDLEKKLGFASNLTDLSLFTVILWIDEYKILSNRVDRHVTEKHMSPARPPRYGPKQVGITPHESSSG